MRQRDRIELLARSRSAFPQARGLLRPTGVCRGFEVLEPRRRPAGSRHGQAGWASRMCDTPGSIGEMAYAGEHVAMSGRGS